ncbi:hypothetical protein B0186_03880 [Canicola haemoglobinophilus]|uniref:Uncharacterized protein n=1 Tax=Canicola haemoglobinophilus TaxID=733 RepID=A0A1V4B2S6_9PAST|nr:hypothetical protein [Canicola haemoglobinophilus]OOS01557.1 hypothetical protein B0186_03880 [Canicola haemoglobinophilus]STO60020.1 Uncharacterised protein [Canicola haemoglobinophilus]
MSILIVGFPLQQSQHHPAKQYFISEFAMNNDYILERMGKIKEIWAEKLHPQLSQLRSLDKELLKEVRRKILTSLPQDFEKLESIYSLMGDIQAILDGREDLAQYLTIEENLREILAIQ